MQETHLNDKTIYINNSFTELFHLLKKTKMSDSCLSLDYSTDELTMMLLNADNAISGLLQGLQTIGGFLAFSTLIEKQDAMQFGHFLTLIANLMEALNVLRGECEEQINSQNIENTNCAVLIIE